MRQLRQPWLRGVGIGLEEGDQLKPQFGEQRRPAPVPGQEAAQQCVPTGIAERLADHREAAGEQAIEVVEDEIAIEAQPALFDARGTRVGIGFAHMRGQHGELVLQRGHAAAACSPRICATSASSVGSGGKLKSRSSKVGRAPWRA